MHLFQTKFCVGFVCLMKIIFAKDYPSFVVAICLISNIVLIKSQLSSDICMQILICDSVRQQFLVIYWYKYFGSFI